jgi:PAS domain S-box-containing protein
MTSKIKKLEADNSELSIRIEEMGKAIKILNDTLVKQRENHINFQQIADTIEQVFWMTDPVKSKMIYISSGYEAIWGHSCEELLVNPVLFLESIHPEDRSFVLSQLPNQILGKYDIEYRIIQPNGNIRWVRDKAFPIRNEAGDVYRVTGLASDITEVKAAQEKMITLEKLASLGSLSAGIAHEIKNPLNLIINAAKVINDEIEFELPNILTGLKNKLSNEDCEDITDLLETVKVMSSIIISSGERGDRIIKTMLLQSISGKAELVVSDVKSCLEDCLNLSYHSMRAEYPFELEIKTDMDDIGEAKLFIQDFNRAIQNLIHNSLYSMNIKNNQITDKSYKAQIKISLKSKKEFLVISIVDNGTGIPDDVRDRVLEPFFTTKPPGEGTGLGLSMVNEIISQQHKGILEINSNVGDFTEIIVKIPKELSEVSNE